MEASSCAAVGCSGGGNAFLGVAFVFLTHCAMSKAVE